MSSENPAFPVSEKVKALQYLFDVARTAPAPAAVHEQVSKYAVFLNASFQPEPKPVAAELPKQDSVAEDVAKATGIPPATGG